MHLPASPDNLAVWLNVSGNPLAGYWHRLVDPTFRGLYQPNAFDLAIMLPYFLVMAVLATFGFHRYALVYNYFKNRKNVPGPPPEVTEWPRGLVDYTPSGPNDETPSAEEDRDLNRLRLASRLLGFARAHGRPMDAAVVRLREADRAFREGDRLKGRRLVDAVLEEVEASHSTAGTPSGPAP